MHLHLFTGALLFIYQIKFIIQRSETLQAILGFSKYVLWDVGKQQLNTALQWFSIPEQTNF